MSAGGTWQHGAEVYQWRPRRAQLFARREEVPFGAVVVSTIARPSKVDVCLVLGPDYLRPFISWIGVATVCCLDGGFSLTVVSLCKVL